jgi:hypothetical protein
MARAEVLPHSPPLKEIMMLKRRRRRRINLGEVTKRDFIAIAKILGSECAPAQVTKRIADYFGSENPRFAKGQFIAAAACKR